ncbi:serine hydrolase [Nocardioides albertanoniae]|uniref:serine hydrolase n=1 Tax=Nocardioides albertanoniae TaxID=1175486 RepID=UPI00114DCA61|nr:serine hydrolase [Nocardioides albertanoniae]
MEPLVSTWLSGLDGIPTQAQNVNQQHYAASLMKVPVAIAAYRLRDRGLLSLDEPTPVHPDFDSAVEGERFEMDQAEDQDPETWAAVGSSLPLGDLVRRSLIVSGNLAANLVLERVGLDQVADVLEEAEVTPMTTVSRGIEDAPAREAGLQNLVTANDMGKVLTKLASGRLLSPESTAELTGALVDQHYRDAIPLGVPEDAVVGNKTGWVDGVRHDMAIIHPSEGDPQVMVVLTTGLDDDESEFRISEVARYLWSTL